MRTREDLINKHGHAKAGEIESKFMEHLGNEHPHLAANKDYVQKYHMNDTKAHNSDHHENTMIKTAIEKGWL